MSHRIIRRIFLSLILLILSVPAALLSFYIYSSATPIKADIHINTKHIVGPLFPNWKSLAQGGEERGVRMLQNVVAQTSALTPRYIRIDHIYDFYDVVGRDSSGQLTFNFTGLDATVCDIYATGAKPFFVLGYMPTVISSDATPIGAPSNWDEWSQVVKTTIEHYSGTRISLCGGSVQGEKLANVYYEVWNEPDLETFGKWSIYGGERDYRKLYAYASKGAGAATNVQQFSLGGPATTAAYKNWMQTFLSYAAQNRLRVDFLSWHHYSTNPDDYTQDLVNIASWVPQSSYGAYSALPKVLSEWGYDSNYNSVADTLVGAAHTIATIRNLIDQKLTMAFTFEVKDGVTPSWGVLTHDGVKKPRFDALTYLNLLDGQQLLVEGEGSFVRAIASTSPQKITVILVNYDKSNKNIESVPVTLEGMTPGAYTINTHYLATGVNTTQRVFVSGQEYSRQIIMSPNNVVAIEVVRSQ